MARSRAGRGVGDRTAITGPSPQRPALAQPEVPEGIPNLELHPTRAEFEQLQREVQHLRDLIYAALGGND